METANSKVNAIVQWFSRRKKARFYYLKDLLFWLCVILYFVNRTIVKPLTIGKNNFFGSYLNDLLCFPIWIPVVLFIGRLIRLRRHDEPPDIYELGLFFLIWSYVFEIAAPIYGPYLNNPVSDAWDVVCYGIGAVISGFYWNFSILHKDNPFSSEEQR